MLYARAASRVCDRVAPDALMGIASVEEIHDELAPESNGGTRTVTPRKKAAPRLVATVATDEPPLDDGPYTAPAAELTVGVLEPELGESVTDVIEAAAVVAGEPITGPQQKMLHALLRKANLAEREAGLAAIAAILGRDVESTKDLSKADATIVIDELVRSTDEPIEPTLDDEWPPTAEPAS
jgi:hypothetical protein